MGGNSRADGQKGAHSRRGAFGPDRRIWAIAGPATLSNVTVASIGLVDSWAIGHLPDPAQLAGLALGAYGMSMLLWSLGFLRMGTTGLVAQAYGARQSQRLLRITLRAVLLGAGIGAIILAAKLPATQAILSVLGADGAERASGAAYLSIRLWAAPFFLVKIAVVGFLIGIQRTDIALYLEVGVNLINVGLTLFFVVGLGLGVEGAAYGSLIAEVIAGLAALGVLAAGLRPALLRRALSKPALWRASPFIALLKVNGFLFARTVLLIIAFGLFIAKAETLGTLTLAACHIMLNFYVLQALTLDALAYAAEALVGEAIGARSRAQMRRWVVRTSIWAFIVGLLYLAVFALFGEALFNIFTDQEGVRAAAAPLFIWIAITPPIAVWCYQFDGVFIGAARAKPMFVTMAMALAVMQLMIWWLVPAYGVTGLCAAFLAFFAVRGVGLALAYLPLERSVIPA